MVAHEGAWPAGTPCWAGLDADDTGEAGAFYAALFGWDVRAGPPAASDCVMCLKRGRAVAGIGPQRGLPAVEGAATGPPSWTTYIASAGADETAARIEAAGGRIMLGPADVAQAGRMALAADPAGAVFGIWQARAHPGAGLAGEPGALCWHENLTRDFEGSKAFYRAVFGYEYGDMSDGAFKYATLKVGGAEAGGIGELDDSYPAGAPAHWSVYFAVGDLDAALAAVTAGGGSVAHAPWDTPYGRTATVADNQGAVFSLVSVGPAATG